MNIFLVGKKSMEQILTLQEKIFRQGLMQFWKPLTKKTGLGVVVLVDEYDKSLLESESEALEESRKLFKGFFGNYWFATGTPTFLLKKLEEDNFDYRKFSTNELSGKATLLQDYREDNPNPVPLFYQTGYLTIKNYDKEYEKYYLGYPNDEVRYSFLDCLILQSLTIL